MSCLYRSLAYFLEGVGPNKLRNIICDYLANDPILFDEVKASKSIPWETNMNFNKYIERMRSHHRWGGAIEIKCFCNIYNINVLVRSYPNGKDIEFLSNKKSDMWAPIYWTGNHYEPMRQVGNLRDESSGGGDENNPKGGEVKSQLESAVMKQISDEIKDIEKQIRRYKKNRN